MRVVNAICKPIPLIFLPLPSMFWRKKEKKYSQPDQSEIEESHIKHSRWCHEHFPGCFKSAAYYSPINIYVKATTISNHIYFWMPKSLLNRWHFFTLQKAYVHTAQPTSITTCVQANGGLDPGLTTCPTAHVWQVWGRDVQARTTSTELQDAPSSTCMPQLPCNKSHQLSTHSQWSRN